MEKIAAAQYCFITVMCMLIMLYILYLSTRIHSPLKIYTVLQITLICSIIFAIADIPYALREFQIVKMNTGLSYFFEIVYSLSSLLCAYFWFVYSELRQGSIVVRSRLNNIIFAVPMLIIALMTVTTPVHHLMFSFDESGKYVRGILNIPFTLIVMTFVAVTGVRGFIKSTQKRFYIIRKQLRTLSLYAVVLVLAQLAQMVFGSIMPFRTIGSTVVFFVVKELYLFNRITLDSLTKINNRGAVEQHLEDAVNEEDPYYVAMIDIDDFKVINDRFGHTSGDDALRMFSEALKMSVPPSDIIGRYGGDEFVIMGPETDPKEIETIMSTLDANLKNILKKYSSTLPVDFSYGYAVKSPDMQTVPDFIDKADKMLYLKKKEKKSGR